ncbi:MAG: hypothetical protein HKM96_10200 [Boseongicola sp.]|nr:hypothetical protein [Boseongicola sp.]
MRALVIFLLCSGCGGVAWNTTVADHPQVRAAMLASVDPGRTTETRFRTRWGQPTQKIREGGQVAYVYRNMSNPPGYLVPQFGDSTAHVVVLFQYGVAVGAYSSDVEGCRATFAPRPPNAHYPNPSTVKPVNCGVSPGADAGRDKGLVATIRDFADHLGQGADAASSVPTTDPYPGVPADRYPFESGGKYR